VSIILGHVLRITFQPEGSRIFLSVTHSAAAAAAAAAWKNMSSMATGWCKWSARDKLSIMGPLRGGGDIGMMIGRHQHDPPMESIGDTYTQNLSIVFVVIFCAITF
jgi:hypothetical protein